MRRPPIYKCPNHLACLTGYHGDDVEIAPGMPPVCPECGGVVERLRSPRRHLPPWLVNGLTILALVAALWLAWPHVVRLWEKWVTSSAPARKR